MKNKICQSCGMPITINEQFGTNENGSINVDYCKYCYEKGEFKNQVTMEEFIEKCSKYGSAAGMTSQEMKEYCTNLFPTLKRWKCTCTDECTSGYNPNCNCENKECHCKEKNS